MRSDFISQDPQQLARQWRERSPQARCRTLAAAAAEVAESADELVRRCAGEQRIDPAETITSELVPLCDALQFLGRRGAKLLRPRHLGVSGRPPWLWGVRSRVLREPLGRVLILGTWNFPLLLPAVQAAQALAAGNTVLLKPAPGTEAATEALVGCLHRAGIPSAALIQLDSSTEAATRAIDHGVELIVLTGSAATGRTVLAQAAESLTPTIMELSGCDAAIALPGADVPRLAQAVAFGLGLNSGATCIAPRRLLVPDALIEEVRRSLRERLSDAPTMSVHRSARAAAGHLIEEALAGGARDLLGRFDADDFHRTGRMAPLVLDRVNAEARIASADLFAPVVSLIGVSDACEAVALVNRCRYRLAASVFGPVVEAEKIASRLDVGTITINDLIVPTADPRLPFGGRGHSGFGVTRGEEGLLAMTRPKVISTRHSRFAPHLSPRADGDAETLMGMLQLTRGKGWSRRVAGLRRMISGVKTRRRS